jgi:hypothetical protein
MNQEDRASSCDELARGLADGSVTRCKVLRLMGAVLVGSTLASLGMGEATAAPPGSPPGCKRNGKTCTKGKQCCSGNCSSGTCQTQTTTSTTSSTTSTSTSTTSTSTSTTSTSTTTMCRLDGEACTAGSQCCSGICDTRGICATCEGVGGPCGAGRPCCGGAVCVGGTCSD